MRKLFSVGGQSPRQFLSANVSDNHADVLFAGHLRRCEASWTLFDDALPALRRARSAGLEVAVLTNGDEDHQRQKLSMLGLVDEVDTLISTSELPAAKPDSGRSVARWNG